MRTSNPYAMQGITNQIGGKTVDFQLIEGYIRMGELRNTGLRESKRILC